MDDVPICDDLSSLESSFSEDGYEDAAESNVINEDEKLDVFLKAVAIKFNDWMHLKHIPYSTCNLIIQEVFNSYSEGKAACHSRIRRCLKDEGWEADKTEELLQKLTEDDPFEQARVELESERKRLSYIRETFEHIEPETVYLDKEHGESYQYISVIKSLKIMLEDDTFIKQKQDDVYFPEEATYKDVRDGEHFKSNKFFKSNPEALPILLFQDELEIANPLGSGKCKHKINATYLTTYEVQSALRSKSKVFNWFLWLGANFGKNMVTSKLTRDLLMT